MFPQGQKRKFVVPGLKRKAPDAEDLVKPAAGSSTSGPLVHQAAGVLKQHSQILSTSSCPAEKENICPEDGTAGLSSTQHALTLQARASQPAKKPFLAPKPGLTGGFKLPAMQKQPLAVKQPSSSHAQEDASSADAHIFSVLYTKRDKFKVTESFHMERHLHSIIY